MGNTAATKKKQFSDTIYKKFSDIPEELIGNGFVTEEAIEIVCSKCQRYAQSTIEDEAIAKLVTQINLISQRKQVDVLDYGGGLGQIYYAVEKDLTAPNAVTWNVLDVEEMVQVGRAKIKDKPGLHFYTNLNEIQKVDIAFFRQSIQVLEYPYDVVKNIYETYDPEIIFLSGVSSGENKTYLSLVLFDDVKGAPCWIFNQDELISSIESIGFDLVDRFDESITIDLSNFEDIKYHLDRQRKNHVKGYVFTNKSIQCAK